jgi:hypothetical protein
VKYLKGRGKIVISINSFNHCNLGEIGMSSPEIREISIHGNKLVCPVCKNDKFWNRVTLMNTSGMTLLGWDWLNREADNYICSECGYVYWFFERSHELLKRNDRESKKQTIAGEKQESKSSGRDILIEL